MLVLSKAGTYKWPVKYQRPSETKPGQYDKFEFVGEFVRLQENEFTDLMESMQAGTVDDGDQRVLAFLDKVFVGWSGIGDSEGVELPCTPVNRKILFLELGIKSAIARAYFDSVTGAARKN
jgi:hypothetical protein